MTQFDYFRIGFHGGGNGGNHNGIGEYFDNAKPPIFKSVDSGGILHEALQRSGGSAILVYRAARLMSDGYDPGIPLYHLDVEEAAQIHWSRTKDFLVLDKPPREAWIEVMNEPDKNRADWLAAVSLRIAQMAMEEGWKTLHFGWSTGEPEPADWGLPHMQQFIQFAERHPEWVGIALHEYSLVDTLEDGYPHLIGRFEHLYDYGVSRAPIFISEFGWHQDRAPKLQDAEEDLWFADDVYARYPNLLGAAIWCLQSWHGDIYNTVNSYIPAITRMSIEIHNMEVEIEPPPPVTDDRIGDAREPYSRVYHRVSSTATLDQFLKVAMEAYDTRSTVGFSADDAGIGVGLKSKKVVEWGDEFDQETITDWYQRWYGVDDVTFRSFETTSPPPPPPVTGKSEPKFGIHASADSWNYPQDLDMIAAMRPDSIKILSNYTPEHLNDMIARYRPQEWVIRSFLSWGGRLIYPNEFYSWTIPDIHRTINLLKSNGFTNDQIVVELHNEPNLTSEGWKAGWDNGVRFNDWYLELLGYYRNALPGIRLIFPGLSPGPGTPWRAEPVQFINDCREAIAKSDGIAIHSYWSNPNFPMMGNVPYNGYHWVKEMRALVPYKPIWITEASNNTNATAAEDKINEYLKFWRSLHNLDKIMGISYFVLSASNPNWGWGGSGEIWIPIMANKAGER